MYPIRFNLFLISTFLLLTPFAGSINLGPRADQTVKTIPSTPTTGPVAVQTASNNLPLNFPKLSAINDTTPELWFFAAVSQDLNSSATVTFFTTTSDGFAFVGDVGSVDSVLVQFTFPNGTSFSAQITATEAKVTGQGDDSSAVWEGSGYDFSCEADLSGCVVDIKDDVNGIEGKIEYTPISPPHFPCSSVQPDQTLLVSPGLGWENAIPGAIATVSLTIQGTPLHFTGIGYQDHNWTPTPFLSTFSSYYWGFTQIGPYTLVYFDVIDLSGKEHVSSYVADGNRILAAQCSGITVRPFGANDQFPPHAGDDDPTGFYVTAELGNAGTLEVTVTAEVVLATVPGLFTRWISRVVGGIQGAEQFESVAINEEFRLT